MGDSSGGVSVASSIRGGLREKITEGGREPMPSFRGVAPLTGDNSEGGEGVSGEGVCQRFGVSGGATFLDSLLLSLLDSLFFEPKVDINESTKRTQGRVNNGVPATWNDDQLTTRATHDGGWISRSRISPSTRAGRVMEREIKGGEGKGHGSARARWWS
jgi:hypothetical protein